MLENVILSDNAKISFAKNLHCFGKNKIFIQNNIISGLLEIF